MNHYENQPALADNVELWRYMGLEALNAMLSTDTLRLTRLDRFNDPFEGSLPHSQIKLTQTQFADAMDISDPMYSWKKRQPVDPLRASISWQDEMRRRREAQIRCAHASCWRHGDECEGMWRLYCADGSLGQGIAIRTTFGQLIQELEVAPVIVGKISYRPYHLGDPFTSDIATYFHKRTGFSHEQELRVLRFQPEVSYQHTRFIAGFSATPAAEPAPYIFLPFRIPAIANEIVVSPYASEDFEERLKALIEAKTPSLATKINYSELSKRRYPRWV